MEDSQFYLASSSPRRRELLLSVGLSFEVISVDVDEQQQRNEGATAFATRMALAKVNRAAELIVEDDKSDLPVLAADTCVTIDNHILGKPSDVEQAKAMLGLLSGRTHVVLTAIALKSGDTIWQDLSRNEVTFASLSTREINAYCASREPFDKAGAYAIQGLGSAFVKHIEGSYTGVVGLPMYETRRLLAKIGVDWL
ncbi:MAG: nucleoside triphosphate pyrophosphatase [Arenicellales bacterium]|nr:nucleoside triphosphate pyrophosphatase [Arenicellales bacterium]